MELLKPAALRGLVYLLVLALGTAAAAAAAAGIGTYNAETGIYVLEVNVNVLGAYIGSMILGGGLSLTALIKGWGNK